MDKAAIQNCLSTMLSPKAFQMYCAVKPLAHEVTKGARIKLHKHNPSASELKRAPLKLVTRTKVSVSFPSA